MNGVVFSFVVVGGVSVMISRRGRYRDLEI